MERDRPSTRIAAAPLAALLLAAAAPLAGQGVTTAVISGRVLDPEGVPVAGARVEARRPETGAAAVAATDEEGGFHLPNLRPAEYSLLVSRIGFATVERAGIRLRLGQTLRVEVTLSEEPLELPELAVRLETDPAFDPSRMGVSTEIDAVQIERLPTISRDFLEFLRLSPLVTVEEDGVSIGGSSFRLNAIQIDGALNQDVFGLSPSGVAGGQARGRLIPLGAIAELEVLTAPYDVRQSGFTGGVVNAVTRQGTNRWEGSVFGFTRDESFVGDLVVQGVERRPEELDNLYGGFTLGGPIVRDRAHFFVAAERESRRRPPNGFHVGLDDPRLTRIDPDSLARFGTLLEGYGVDPGEAGSYTLDNDLTNVFARVDLRIGEGNTALLRYNFASADDDPEPNRLPGEPYELSSNAVGIGSRNHSVVGQWLSDLGGGWSNDLLLNAQFLRDDETPRGRYPRIEVDMVAIQDGLVLQRPLRAGAAFFAQQSALDQDILQISNGLTWARGPHRLLIGASFERFDIDRLYLPASLGAYRFASLADLEAGLPSRYDVNLRVGEGAPRARFAVHQWAGYLQDEWRVSDALNVRLGLRVDIPVMTSAPARNADAVDAFGLDTSVLPSGNALFSPRAGFNLRLGADRATQIRGGAGLFAGRPPFAWLAGAFLENGLESVLLTCDQPVVGGVFVGAAAFDPAGPSPSACNEGAGGTARPGVTAFDPDFRFPQDFRASLSIDQRLPLGIVGTLEGLYTKAVHQIALRNLNLGPAVPAGVRVDSLGYTDGFGFGARPAYGDATVGGFAPRVVTEAFGPVIEVGNRSVNFAYALSARLRRQFGNRARLEVGYAFNRSADAQSLFSLDATANYAFTPVDGDPNEPERQASLFDRPHKVVVNASARVLERFGGTEIALIYVGQSGAPYSFVYLGDVNGDGFPGFGTGLDFTNDLIYVPTSPSDHPGRGVSGFIFEQLAAVEPCLDRNRGAILARNACRTSWSNQVDVRVTQSLRLGGVRAQLFFDLLNALNFLSSDWGRVELANPVVQILQVPGRFHVNPLDPTPEDPLFVRHNGPIVGTLEEGLLAVRAPQPATPASQWQLQLGVRLSF